jgi:hypothetical protein
MSGTVSKFRYFVFAVYTSIRIFVASCTFQYFVEKKGNSQVDVCTLGRHFSLKHAVRLLERRDQCQIYAHHTAGKPCYKTVLVKLIEGCILEDKLRVETLSYLVKAKNQEYHNYIFLFLLSIGTIKNNFKIILDGLDVSQSVTTM